MNEDRQIQLRAHRTESFHRKERDLPLVILFEIKKPISFDSAPRDAFDFGDLQRRMRVRRLAVVSEKIMARRNIEVANSHSRELQSVNSEVVVPVEHR